MNNDQTNEAKKTVASAVTEMGNGLQKAGQNINDKIDSLGDAAQGLLGAATNTVQSLQKTAASKSRDMAKCTDEFVQQKPWKAVGVAMLVGWGFGLYMSRNKNLQNYE